MKDFLRDFILPGLAYLPEVMNTPGARAMIFATGMQESRFEDRFQIGGGPARGFHQFERGNETSKGGIWGVMHHPATGDLIKKVCRELVIRPTVDDCYEAIAYNDPLDTCFARLLLWTLPNELPNMGEYEKGYDQYIKAWRPGRPHPETWKSYFNTAWLCCN